MLIIFLHNLVIVKMMMLMVLLMLVMLVLLVMMMKKNCVFSHTFTPTYQYLLYLRHIARILSNLMLSLSIPGQTIHTAPSAAGVENLEREFHHDHISI